VGLGDANVFSAAIRKVGVFSVAFELVSISGSLPLRVWGAQLDWLVWLF
jgi:hypothetical protein